MTCSKARPVLLLALLLSSLPVAAQVTDTEPIKVKAPKVRIEKFKGEVLFMTPTSITARSRDNSALLRTFIFEEKLAAKMRKQIDKNKTYQHGDRVEIRYQAGTDRAVKIKGKPGQDR